MSTSTLWEQFQHGGLEAVNARQATTAGERHYLSVLAASERAWKSAAEWACEAAQLQPGSLLLREAAEYLQRRAEGQRDGRKCNHEASSDEGRTKPAGLPDRCAEQDWQHRQCAGRCNGDDAGQRRENKIEHDIRPPKS